VSGDSSPRFESLLDEEDDDSRESLSSLLLESLLDEDDGGETIRSLLSLLGSDDDPNNDDESRESLSSLLLESLIDIGDEVIRSLLSLLDSDDDDDSSRRSLLRPRSDFLDGESLSLASLTSLSESRNDDDESLSRLPSLRDCSSRLAWSSFFLAFSSSHAALSASAARMRARPSPTDMTNGCCARDSSITWLAGDTETANEVRYTYRQQVDG